MIWFLAGISQKTSNVLRLRICFFAGISQKTSKEYANATFETLFEFRVLLFRYVNRCMFERNHANVAVATRELLIYWEIKIYTSTFVFVVLIYFGNKYFHSTLFYIYCWGNFEIKNPNHCFCCYLFDAAKYSIELS